MPEKHGRHIVREDSMRYTGHQLDEIIFPLGGIGTGCIGLGGNGLLRDFEIFNRPAKGSQNGYTHLALRAAYSDGSEDVRVLMGDVQTGLMGSYRKDSPFSGYGFGPYSGTMCAWPHFRNCVFEDRFPFAILTLTDPDFPSTVRLRAFNPMIPLNAYDSSLPGAVFQIEIESEKAAEYTVFFAVRNPFEGSVNEALPEKNSILLCCTGLKSDDPGYGDMCIRCLAGDGDRVTLQEYWYRGGWQDSIATYQKELFRDGRLNPRHYDTPGSGDTCTVADSFHIDQGGTGKACFILTWSVPNQINYWNPFRDADGKDITWKNYYATVFPSSADSCAYFAAHLERLDRESTQFSDALYSSTLDETVIDAAASSLCVLHSPTVLRLEDGSFYGWEGCTINSGSCEGTCSHVWNYAYALCFLFPELEISLRDNEFRYNLKPDGMMDFRMPLPLGREKRGFPCVDGAMGSIIKICREWKLGAGDSWMASHFPDVKAILDYTVSPDSDYRWDADGDGVLEGCQHHTLDMELFGPSSWLEGFYLAALEAACEMAEYLGKNTEAEVWHRRLENGMKWTRENLFNGSYFIQKVDIHDSALPDAFPAARGKGYWNEESGELKYQIASGCEIDQVLADWHTGINGLPPVFDREQRRRALHSLYQYNFKPNLRNHVNTWRVFALNDEAAAVMCTYPDESTRPVIPIPYTEEAMTGFEYALAGQFAQNGMVRECTDIVRAIRGRYAGHNRNPFNEIECGSNYARCMAAFALLPILSGLSFDAPHGSIGLVPAENKPFKGFFSVGTAWGSAESAESGTCLTLLGGRITLRTLTVPGTVEKLLLDGREAPFIQRGGTLSFDTATVTREIRAVCAAPAASA